MERRLVLLTDGMSNDFLLIITDAPTRDIKEYCRYHVEQTENGGYFELFATLKTQYYVKELLDSEVDNAEDLEILTKNNDVECFDFSDYKTD